MAMRDESAVLRDTSLRIARIGDRTLDATCPIYADTGKPYPELVGSSVLFAVQDARFVLSAAHVLDYSQRHDIYIGGASELVALGGRYFVTRMPGGGGRAADKIDLAIFELSPNQIAAIGNSRYVSPEETAPAHSTNDTPVTGSYYIVSGYPISRQPTRLTQGGLVANPVYVATKAQPQAELAAKGLSSRHSFLLEFDKENSMSARGPRMAPNPHGLSGGGVWVIEGLLSTRPDIERLVGIAIEWHKTTKSILATRIGLYLDPIAAHFPSLRPFLPQPEGRPGSAP